MWIYGHRGWSIIDFTTVDSMSRNSLTWPLCLLFVAGIAFGRGGDVLCLGDNGHARVESACQPCCGVVEEACVLADVDISHDHHKDCSNCIDLPLNQDTWCQVRSNRSADPVPIILIWSATFTSGPTDLHSLRLALQATTANLVLSPGSRLSASILRC